MNMLKAERWLTDRYMSGQVARYYYRKGDIRKCMRELLRSEFTYKNLGMFLTVAIPTIRRWVLRNFKVAGIPCVKNTKWTGKRK